MFGDCARHTPAGAALLNGALGHSLDSDDTHAAGSLHPGCTVISAALATGQMVGASAVAATTRVFGLGADGFLNAYAPSSNPVRAV